MITLSLCIIFCIYLNRDAQIIHSKRQLKSRNTRSSLIYFCCNIPEEQNFLVGSSNPLIRPWSWVSSTLACGIRFAKRTGFHRSIFLHFCAFCPVFFDLQAFYHFLFVFQIGWRMISIDSGLIHARFISYRTNIDFLFDTSE